METGRVKRKEKDDKEKKNHNSQNHALTGQRIAYTQKWRIGGNKMYMYICRGIQQHIREKSVESQGKQERCRNRTWHTSLLTHKKNPNNNQGTLHRQPRGALCPFELREKTPDFATSIDRKIHACRLYTEYGPYYMQCSLRTTRVVSRWRPTRRSGNAPHPRLHDPCRRGLRYAKIA